MKHLANILTVLRIVLTAVLAVFLLVAPFSVMTTRTICAVVFFVAAVTDFIDGQIARKTKTVSDFGKFLDPVADKLLITASLICLAVSPLVDEKLHVLLAACAVVVLFRDLCITSLRLLAAGRGIVLAAGMSGKVKTFFQCVCVMWILLEPLFCADCIVTSVVMLIVCIVLTLYSGLVFVPVYQKAMRQGKEAISE